MSISYDILRLSSEPSEIISKETWLFITEKVKNSIYRDAYLYDISMEIGLDWPYSRRYEPVTHFTDKDIEELNNTPGLGRKKVRTIILCLAYIALIKIGHKIRSINATKKNSNGYSEISFLTDSRPRLHIVERKPVRENTLLDSTYFDVIDVSDKEIETLETKLSQKTFIDLGIYSPTVRYYNIVAEDSLDILLSFTFRYFLEIWKSENEFNMVLFQLIEVVEKVLQRKVQLDTSKFSTQLLFSRDFINCGIKEELPLKIFRNTLENLFPFSCDVNDLQYLSEKTIVERFGICYKTFQIIYTYNEIHDSLADLVSLLNETKKGISIYESPFDTIKRWSNLVISNKRNAEILMMRFGLIGNQRRTLEEIAKHFKLTKERVRQLIKKNEKNLTSANSFFLLQPFWQLIESIFFNFSILRLDEFLFLSQNIMGWSEPLCVDGISYLVRIHRKFTDYEIENREGVSFIRLQPSKCIDCNIFTDIILDLIEEKSRISLISLTEIINKYCISKSCSSKTNMNYGFVHYRLLEKNENIQNRVKISGDTVFSRKHWNIVHGRLIDAVEQVLLDTGKPIHFTKVHEQLTKYRNVNAHAVHAALDKCEKAILWDRGTFVHQAIAPFPFNLLRRIEDWLETQLSKNRAFITVYGAIAKFKKHCLDEGITSEPALYTCLKISNDERFEYPKYPYIYLKGQFERFMSPQVILEEYIQQEGGLVPLQDVLNYANKLFIKDYSTIQYIDSIPDVLRSSKGYVHADYLKLDPNQLNEITNHIYEFLKNENHVSIDKIFVEKRVTCNLMNVNDSLLLYNVLRRENNLLVLDKYPQIRLAINDESNKKISLSNEIINFVKRKQDYCSYKEIENYFVEKLGYRGIQFHSLMHGSENVCKYLYDCVVHVDTIKWSEKKQQLLEDEAHKTYLCAVNQNIPYGAIQDLIEYHELPALGNSLYWTESLVAELLCKNKKFIILGNNHSVFLPVENIYKIENFEDLLYHILKTEYEGASQLGEFEDDMRRKGIVKRKVTNAMLNRNEKVIIIDNEIILRELQIHA